MPRALGFLLALLLALSATTSSQPAVADQPRPAVGRQLLPEATARFVPDHLVWAKGSRIHDGSTVLKVGSDKITWMLRSPFGFFLELAKSYRSGSRMAFFDGTHLTRLHSGAQRPAISPDGRYAGWVDRGGPKIRYGRSQRVRIVDLASGRLVFETSEGMGQTTDIYEEIGADFLGFDDQYAYWNRVTGPPRRQRVDIATWQQTSVAATVDEDGFEIPVGEPYDSLTGRKAILLNGKPTTSPFGGEIGFVSVDGRFAVNLSTTARLKITDAATGRRIDPDWGGRWRGFVGWQDADTFYAALPETFPWSDDLRHPDGVRAWLATCDLPSGACTRVQRYHDIDRTIFGWGGGFEAGF